MQKLKFSILTWLFVIGTSKALAVSLYTIDITNDNLVRIDSTSGSVSNIGPLGFNATRIDLALTSDGRLWGLNTIFGSRVDLLEIDKTTGAVLSEVQIFDGTTAVKHAEGLGAQGSQLNIAYAQTGIANNGNSNQFADLSSGGIVSNVRVSNIDMDGLAGGSSNSSTLYAMDREPGSQTSLYSIDPINGLGAIVGTYSDSLGFHDLVTLQDEAIAIDTFTNNLYRIDLNTGLFIGTATAIQTGLDYDGLALAVNTYTIGGSVFGLGTGNSIVLQNNSGDDLTINTNGTFTFSTALADLSTYAVTVLTNPASPNQTCIATNDAGTLAGANITNVNISCTTNTYTIGGFVSGLGIGNSVVLQNNSGDDLTINTNGTFTFSTALADLSTYAVTVLTNPASPNQTCIATNDAGTLAGANITNVSINCITNISSTATPVPLSRWLFILLTFLFVTFIWQRRLLKAC